MSRKTPLALLVAVLCLPTGLAALQHPSATRPPSGTRPPPGTLRVIRATSPVHLDGRLTEPFWAHADSISDFRQREPDVGAPATERTVVRAAMSATALYIAVRAYEAPSQIRATQLQRDAHLHYDDNVQLLIDSFDQRRSAFLFGTNPNGDRADAQIEGSSGYPNLSWNGIWDVAVSRDSAGWTAEFRIPFQTLRFQSGTTTFGFNVRRLIRRNNEEDLWRGWHRTQGLYRLYDEGQLTGLGGARRGGLVAFRPYVLGRAEQAAFDTLGARLSGSDATAKVGLDAKLPVSGTLTADFTVNTDFAQVEADQQMINLSRYPLFFPEKREFFLESSGIFNLGSSRRAQLFYSRRIGLNDSGPVPILGGARLYGRKGPWVVGLLDVRTGGQERANDVAVRVRHDVLQNGYVGGMATLRSGPGLPGQERAGGVDLDLPLVWHDRTIEPSFWLMATQTPDSAGTPVAWRLALDYPNDLWRGAVSVDEIGRGFDPTLGFVRRTNVLEMSGRLEYQPRPAVPHLRRLDFKIIPSWDVQTPVGGSLLDPADWQAASIEWRPFGGDLENGDHFEINIQRHLDAPTDSFELYTGVNIAPGRYWWTRGEVQYQTGGGGALGLHGSYSWGGFYTGTDRALHLNGTWRVNEHLTLNLNVSRDAVRLPSGRFTALAVGSKTQYAFTTRSDFLAYIQYNGESRRADFDLRFHWIPKIGDDVYVVWNSGYATGADAAFRFPTSSALRRPLDGALVIKAVHRFTM